MFSRITTAALSGLEASAVSVETDLVQGLPCLNIVGLPDISIREARERIRSAIIHSGLRFPAQRITVNLSPADIRKEGTHFDLPIAVGLLASLGMVEGRRAADYAFIGELSLDGRLAPIRGALSLCMGLFEAGFHNIVLPFDNLEEVSVLKEPVFYPARRLSDLVGWFSGKGKPVSRKRESRSGALACEESQGPGDPSSVLLDFREVTGQESAKRALQVAAAGFHGVLMIGPAGCGKTMLAARIPSILPELTEKEAIEVARIRSVSQSYEKQPFQRGRRPFRSPHHTITAAAMAGGGLRPKPGEVTLAHRGVLFLDELPEFRREVLELLRQPMENKEVMICRTGGNVAFPANFMFVGAMNPCPCGHFGDERKSCRCSEAQIRRYSARLSGPLLDRIDLHLAIPSVSFQELRPSIEEGEKMAEISSSDLKEGVERAWKMQKRRWSGQGIAFNSQMNGAQIKEFCPLNSDSRELLSQAFSHYGLSLRSCQRILRLSRTIADLEQSWEISSDHLAEAIRYRCLDEPGLL